MARYRDSATVETVGVVGAGVIGCGWIACLLAEGLDVMAYDPGAEAAARRRVAELAPVLERAGRPAALDQDRLHFTATLAELSVASGFIQESLPERLELKQATLREIDACAPQDVVIASSTSALLASDLQALCATPERVLSGHPYNPAHLVPLVEVSGGSATDPEAVEAALAFYRRIGKHPIRLRREISGHIAGRLGAALWREAVHLAAEGVATVADIDAAVAYGPGLRWASHGPHMTYNLAGGAGGMAAFLEHLGPSQEGRWRSLGDPSLDPAVSRVLLQGVAEEIAGRSYAELAADRDDQLIAVLKALAPFRDASQGESHAS